MKRILQKYYFLVLLIIGFSTGVLSGKTSQIHGKIVDENNQPVIGANIILKGTVLGSATNTEGMFSIRNVPFGNFTLAIYYLGYEELDLEVSIEEAEYDVGTIRLTPAVIDSDPIVVTASKYEQRTQDVSVSMSTLSKKDLSYRNSITVGDALKYVPGVNMNSSQVNIRGSSGYSYSVGSRVLMLLDGVPFITGDTGEINFESIPTHLIQRIEVLKGAGSALYGSNALGGVINVITKDISTTPTLYAKIYGGMYSDPYYSEWKWSDDNRFLNGQQFNYSQKFNHIGVMVGGNRFEDDSYKQNDWRRRYSGNGKVEWDISPYQQLSISGNYMWQDRASFIYWKNLRDALQPPADQLDDRVESKRSYLSGSYHHVINQHQYLRISGIWYRNQFEDNTEESGNRSISNNVNGEIQFITQVKKHLFTVGATGSSSLVDSDIFGNRYANGIAGYLQDEINWNSQFKTTIGARFDYADIEELGSDSRLNPKFGMVLKPYFGTALRASFGMGFRAPSLAEAFTTTNISGIRVIPNTDNLKSERSVSMEAGINQIIGDWLVFDVSVFHNDFWDLVEPTFAEYDYSTGFLIQFMNITRAQIRGLELKIDSKYFGNFLNVSLGYTYVDPKDLEKNEFLTFRPRHLFYGSGRINISVFQVGMDYRYIGRYDRIDELFTDPLLRIVVPDLEKRVEAHLVDLRLASVFKLFNQPIRISIQANNIFQYNYVEAVGLIAPIRNFVLTFETGL